MSLCSESHMKLLDGDWQTEQDLVDRVEVSDGECGAKLEHGSEHRVSDSSEAGSGSDGGSEHGADCNMNTSSRG